MENITIDNFEYKNNMSVNNDFTVADVMNANDEEFEKLLDEFDVNAFEEASMKKMQMRMKRMKRNSRNSNSDKPNLSLAATAIQYRNNLIAVRLQA